MQKMETVMPFKLPSCYSQHFWSARKLKLNLMVVRIILVEFAAASSVSLRTTKVSE